MMEHVLEWLDAYHDGELHGRQLHRVEEHLAQCEMCRDELESLDAFSALLQESPPAENLMQSHQKSLMRPEQFVAQVGLMLPRRPEQARHRPVFSLSHHTGACSKRRCTAYPRRGWPWELL